jgi:lactoylglutathione lyase
MQYLHTMVRIRDIDESLDFYCNKLGLEEVSRMDLEGANATLIFLAAPEDVARAKEEKAPMLELTYNWEPEDYDGGRNFGHLAFRVDNIYDKCQHLMDNGVTINRPPRDGRMAFVRSPDGISVELLQKGDALPQQEPWASMPNTGSW